jgi:hypothetical protein
LIPPSQHPPGLQRKNSRTITKTSSSNSNQCLPNTYSCNSPTLTTNWFRLMPSCLI